jgi:tripartite-type tricarboxylate transporter receptor subunit TctC
MSLRWSFARHAIVFAVFVTPLLAAASAPEQTYPSRRIVIVVPYTPGSGFDIVARNVGQKIAERWGQPVVVDNKTGASSTIGTEAVVNAEADGYTVMVTGSPLTVSPALSKSLRYDPVAGLTPLGTVGASGLALTVNSAALPIRSLADFLAETKAKPGKFNYSSPGTGTLQHVGMELLKQQLGFDAVHVPYRGASIALTDLLTGQVQFSLLPVHTALPHVQSGQLRMIAIAGATRTPFAPDVPSFAELAHPGLNFDLWYGFFGPANLSMSVVQKWENELAAIIELPDVKDNFRTQGQVPGFRDAAATGALVKSEIARWRAVVEKAGIKPE